jgi:hypothetical protein
MLSKENIRLAQRILSWGMETGQENWMTEMEALALLESDLVAVDLNLDYESPEGAERAIFSTIDDQGRLENYLTGRGCELLFGKKYLRSDPDFIVMKEKDLLDLINILRFKV